jgi:CRP/FNR family transcriptional regulator, cyclic AMP receptor protein
MTEGLIAPGDHWLFYGVPVDVLKPALEAGHEVRFLPGEVIFHEGEEPNGLYLLTAGAARVAASGDDGETFLAVVRANDVVGEMGVLDGERRSGTATAINMCAAYFIPTDPFLDLLESSSGVCMRLLALLTQRLRRANGRLGELPPSGMVTIEEPLPEG